MLQNPRRTVTLTEKLDLFTADGERKYLTHDERQNFMAAAMELKDRHRRTFCLTLAHSGCRISEGLALSFNRIDMSGGQLVFQSLKKRNGKKQQRAVPVPPSYLQTLDLVHNVRAVQKQPRKRTAPLWPIARMTGYRWICETMQAAGVAGAMAHPHSLRHAFGVQALMKDIPLPLLQRWMGHADLETTAIYLQVIGNEEKSFAGRMWEDD
ncbi:MAG: integrase/recombinase XerD [Gammaproteobacteria bacterium]|jgi:integrase/recombinase XerD